MICFNFSTCQILRYARLPGSLQSQIGQAGHTFTRFRHALCSFYASLRPS